MSQSLNVTDSSCWWVRAAADNVAAHTSDVRTDPARGPVTMGEILVIHWLLLTIAIDHTTTSVLFFFSQWPLTLLKSFCKKTVSWMWMFKYHVTWLVLVYFTYNDVTMNVDTTHMNQKIFVQAWNQNLILNLTSLYASVNCKLPLLWLISKRVLISNFLL